MQIKLKLDQDFIIIGVNGKEHVVSARTAAEALGVFLKRGRFGLGKAWSFTRQPTGWIVAVDTASRTLERRMFRLREKNYTRGMR